MRHLTTVNLQIFLQSQLAIPDVNEAMWYTIIGKEPDTV